MISSNIARQNVRVCGTIRANRGIPRDLEREGKSLKKGHSAFRRKSVVKVLVWKDKRLARMISTIHEATLVNTGWKDKKTNKEIKKPDAVAQYNKFTKGIDRADRSLSYYSVLRKTVKLSKKVVLYLLNCELFNAFFLAPDTKYKQNSNIKELPASGRKVLDIGSPESKWAQL
jgi:hypothetical protein